MSPPPPPAPPPSPPPTVTLAITWGAVGSGEGTGGVASIDEVSYSAIDVVANEFAFATIQEDRTVRAWGLPEAGGDLAPGTKSALVGVRRIIATTKAFAAIKSDGTVIAWGDATSGGDAGGLDLRGTVALYSNDVAFVALKYDGSLRAWGPEGAGGNVPEYVSRFCSQGVSKVHHTKFAFFAECAPRPECTCRAGRSPYRLFARANPGKNAAEVCPTYKSHEDCLQHDSKSLLRGGQIYCEYSCPEKVHRGGFVAEWKDYEGDFAAAGCGDVVNDDNGEDLLRTLRLGVAWGDSEYGGTSWDCKVLGLKLRQNLPLAGRCSHYVYVSNLPTEDPDQYCDKNCFHPGSTFCPRDFCQCAVGTKFLDTEIVQVASTSAAFGAVLANGRVVTWGREKDGTGAIVPSESPWTGKTDYELTQMRELNEGTCNDGTCGKLCATELYASPISFVAKLEKCPDFEYDPNLDQSKFTPLIAWGRGTWNEDEATRLASAITIGYPTVDRHTLANIAKAGGVKSVSVSQGAFAVLTNDGDVYAWGSASYGGNCPADAPNPCATNVTALKATDLAFSVVLTDGTVQAWGDAKYGGTLDSATHRALAADGGVSKLYANHVAFAALTNNGSVFAWGDPDNGGNSSSVASSLVRLNIGNPILDIQPSGSAFTAVVKSNYTD